jgi:hypothetical protein
MAIGIGSIVSPKATLIGIQVVQGILFGRVVSGADPFVVLWYPSGVDPETIPATALDEISITALSTSLVGQRVKVTSPDGQNIWGLAVCIAQYRRGDTLVEYSLLQNIVGGAYLEVLTASCVAEP